jgi:hypothetical protein
MFDHPPHDRLVDRNATIDVGLQSGLVAPEQVLELLDSVLGAAVRLRLANSRGLGDHLLDALATRDFESLLEESENADFLIAAVDDLRITGIMNETSKSGDCIGLWAFGIDHSGKHGSRGIEPSDKNSDKSFII